MEKENREPLLRFYQEQFNQLRFLFRCTLALFCFVLAISFIYFYLHFHGPEVNPELALGCFLMGLALAAGAGHITIRFSYATWNRRFLIGQAEKGLGLTPETVPVSFQFYPPATLGEFLRLFLFSFQGPIFIFYLVLGWTVGVIHLPYLIDMPFSLVVVLSLVPPLLLGGLSFYTSYRDTRHRLIALRRVVDLEQATGPEAAELSCDLAEVLLRLQPPQTMEALRQYHQALALDPQNPRALQGIEKIMSWKAKEGKSQG